MVIAGRDLLRLKGMALDADKTIAVAELPGNATMITYVAMADGGVMINYALTGSATETVITIGIGKA